MVFGKIEYLNLLPFHVFMKRYIRSSQIKAIMQHKKNVPAKVNNAFLQRHVDAAFISSIKAYNHKHVNLGIIAKQEVLSVFVLPKEKIEDDKESASSNVLAKILAVEGKVVIGDKALRYALDNNDYIDLADLWHQRYKLPFVFALLCYHKEHKRYKKLEQAFLKHPTKIPYYLLNHAAKQTNVSPKDILYYLTLISYNLDTKAKKGLQKFYKEAKKTSML